jgi:trehalose 6-phosphate synthase
LIISLIVGVALVSLLSTYYEVRREKQGLRNELERRAEVLGESLVGNVEPHLDKGSLKELKRVVERFSNREHLAGVAVFNAKLEPIAQSPGLKQDAQSQSFAVPEAIEQNKKQGRFVRRATGSVFIYALPLHQQDQHQQDQIVGELVIVHDASYINAQSAQVWREDFLRVLLQVVLIALTTLLIVRWSITGPIARAAQWMQALRTGKISSRPAACRSP